MSFAPSYWGMSTLYSRPDLSKTDNFFRDSFEAVHRFDKKNPKSYNKETIDGSLWRFWYVAFATQQAKLFAKSDNLSISRSTQTDFDIKVRYDFTDTSNSTSHYSVDLKQPSLTITYESEPIDQSIQDEINEIFEDLQEEVFEDIEEFIFEEETFTFNEEPQFEMEVEMEMETIVMVARTVR